MLASVTPSLDVTGGPWYAGNDLDTEFIGALQSLAKQFIRKKVRMCRSIVLAAAADIDLHYPVIPRWKA